MTEQKKPLQKEILPYLGKTLVKKGVSTKDGVEKEWKLWKLQFDTGRQYPWTCKSFDTLSEKGIQLSDMEEGKYYEVLYKCEDYLHPQYGQQTSRTAVLIKVSDESQSTAGSESKATNQTTPQTVPTEKTPQDWVTFQESYNGLMEGKKEKTRMHMLGAYVEHNHSSEFASVIALCKKNFS